MLNRLRLNQLTQLRQPKLTTLLRLVLLLLNHAKSHAQHLLQALHRHLLPQLRRLALTLT
ncbi:MAG: hypothetical protein CMN60_20355 [Sphingobium sp.]|nr:hypothetical protein [Sphingobium sp.]